MIESHLAEKHLAKSGIYQRLQDVPWRDRGEALAKLDFKLPPDFQFVELSRNAAASYLARCLSRDLCYGTRLRSMGDSENLAHWFVESFHRQSRFLTNSGGSDPGGNGWGFTPLFAEATMDTGIIVRTGKELTGVMWVTSID